jgi:hypothetical protein
MKILIIILQLTQLSEEDTDWKITQFDYVQGTLGRAMKGKVRLESQLKLYKIMVVPSAVYRNET